MKALDYDVQRALDILGKGKAPRGVNDEVINEFIKSEKDIATLNLRDGKRADNKATAIRGAIKRLGLQEKVVVFRKGDNIVLVRKERMRALGL